MQVHFNCFDYFHITSEKERIHDHEIASHQIHVYSKKEFKKDVLSVLYKDRIVQMGYPRNLQSYPLSIVSSMYVK